MAKRTKKTPLHAWHTARGAKMAAFAGYDMPLWYSSAKDEHLAVLTAAGMFDTSHMAVLMVNGPEALDLLQWCFTNNLGACMGPARKPLYPGSCVYGAFLNDKGEVIDDAIVFQTAANHYMVVVNAGMGATLSAHLLRQAAGRAVAVHDLTDQVGKIDVQGPAAAKIVSGMLKASQNVFNALPYFAFKGHFQANPPMPTAVLLRDGTPVLVSRTGYTGELGFELFVEARHTVAVWEALLAAGEPLGLIPCGLAARDSLRAGAVLPLSHQDIGPWPFINHPWPFALPYNEDRSAFTKNFLGADALRANPDADFTYPFVGRDLRKVTTDGKTRVLDSRGEAIGTVLTCATDMGIGTHEGRILSVASPDRPPGFKPKGLACGFVKVQKALSPGDEVVISDQRRQLPVTIVSDIRPDRTARRPLKETL